MEGEGEEGKKPVGFPPTNGALTNRIHRTEKQSSSTRRQLRVGAKSGLGLFLLWFTEAPRGRDYSYFGLFSTLRVV